MIWQWLISCTTKKKFRFSWLLSPAHWSYGHRGHMALNTIWLTLLGALTHDYLSSSLFLLVNFSLIVDGVLIVQHMKQGTSGGCVTRPAQYSSAWLGLTRAQYCESTLFFSMCFMSLSISIFPYNRHTSAPSWLRWTRTSPSLTCTTGRRWRGTADTTSARFPRTSTQ